MVSVRHPEINKLIFIMLILLVGLTYFISPIFTLVLSSIILIMSKKETIGFSFLLGFSISYPALYYLPIPAEDASRLYQVVEGMRSIQLNGLISWLQLSARDYLNYPIFSSLMYIVSQTLKTTFLSFIASGLTYTIVCYLTTKFARIFQLSKLTVALTLLANIFWISFVETISGMRFPLASCIVILIILNLFVYREHISYFSLLYFLIPLGIHPGVIILIIPIIFIWIMKKYDNLLLKIIMIVLAVATFILVFNGQVFQNDYTGMLLRRFNSYTTIRYDYVFTPQKIMHLILGIIITFISFILLKKIAKDAENSVLFARLNQLNLIYLIYYCLLIMSINLDVRMMVATPLIAILGIAARTSNRLYVIPQWQYFVVLLLILIIIIGLIYNKAILRLNFETIKWFFPLAKSFI